MEEKQELNFKLWPWNDENAKPFFTNEEGVEWWVDKDTTEWAHREDSQGTSLKNIVGFILRKDEKSLTRVLMDRETNNLVYSSDLLEAVACHIDMLKAAKRYDG